MADRGRILSNNSKKSKAPKFPLCIDYGEPILPGLLRRKARCTRVTDRMLGKGQEISIGSRSSLPLHIDLQQPRDEPHIHQSNVSLICMLASERFE
jgi:hypothetical protein